MDRPEDPIRNPEKQDWHAIPVSEVLRRLNSSTSGLSSTEVDRRRHRYGDNKLPEGRQRPVVQIILGQLRNPLTFILFVAALISYSLGHGLDAGFIIAVVVIDTIIGTAQEWRAEVNAASLKKTLQVRPTVIRNGQKTLVDVAEIVPGDLVLLDSGSVVPADMRLVSETGLKTDESLLTGESRFVDKTVDGLCEPDAPVGDRSNMVFAGSMTTSGRGMGVVCATAATTQLGHIAKLLTARGGKAPLLHRMELFSNRIAFATLAIALMIGIGQFARGTALSEVFLITVALAVSAIPEGLPMAITVALSVASARMGQRHVIVRHLPAVEALGSCTVIASDKTGTLTANRLTIKRIFLPDGTDIDVEGEGLELEGALSTDEAALSEARQEMAISLATAGIRTNEADVRIESGAVLARGDTVDIAFQVLAWKLGVTSGSNQSGLKELATIPYESENGYSASLRASVEGGVLYVKGAPEVILPMCSGVEQSSLDVRLDTLTRAGFRVLAVAESGPLTQTNLLPEDLHDLHFLGFVGLVDPIRSEAYDAVDAAFDAGIDVRMITGDHPETAAAIAHDISEHWKGAPVVTGRTLNELDEPDRQEAILNARIFARVEPAQKNEIVSTLQKEGHFVAVTGDGVNDAPALKRAHVGIAMGAGGTDVARAASDLIITDDNFGSIVAGIEEGRASYDNIRKIVWLLISTAITEVLIFTFALFLGLPIPLTAVQILWLNLVTEGIQDVALAFEGKEPDLMKRKPRHPKEAVFDRQMIEQCLIVGLWTSFLAFGVYYWQFEVQGLSVDAARNMTLLYLVLFNNFHTLNCRSETRSLISIPFTANQLLIWSVIGAQLVHIAAMHIPFFRSLLDISPVSFMDWLLVLVLASSTLVLGEVYKIIVARPRATERHAKISDLTLVRPTEP